jgi:type III secretion protein C
MSALKIGRLAASAAVSWLTCGTVATAASLNLAGPEFSVLSRGMKVSALLKEFGSNYGVPVIVSADVNDTFVGTSVGSQPEQVLDQLARLYNLAWYFDGRVIYVYKAQEVATDVLNPSYLEASELVQYLRETGLLTAGSCSVREVKNFNAVEVFGVPICLQRIVKLTKDLDQKTLNQNQTLEVVQVFPLRYASAIDSTYSYRDQKVVIPGVVSELREMHKGRSLAVPTGGGQMAPPQGTDTTFSADARNNAVIVRDRKANMSLYSELIRQLDQRPQQIEISVTIIDVDAGDMRELGLNVSGQVGFGGAKVSLNTPNGFAGGTTASNGTFSALLNSSAEFFLKISALEQNSKARILSRPSVVTLNNVQAVLDRSVTFYTKIQGERVADLASVATGSLLRVTPRIIDAVDHKEVMLTLDIQDGRQEGVTSNTEQLPQTKNSGIATQAILKPGQSLLLGGFVDEKRREGVTKIPFLGDLPIIGGLFRNQTTESNSVVRLFLIKAEPHALN